MPEEMKKPPETLAPPVETPPTPETAPEAPAEQPAEERKEAALEAPSAETGEKPSAAPPPISAQPAQKDADVVAIEGILSEGLAETYQTMPPAAQAKFRQRGEEVAQKIKELVGTAGVKAKGILRLIRDWLRMIPGVNRFFLEQEAKIKTDKIIAYAERKGEEE
ncbi:MAG: hypothetical protein Q8P82_03440 [bacterium]|nr:hypothetical protein [bacterium]